MKFEYILYIIAFCLLITPLAVIKLFFNISDLKDKIYRLEKKILSLENKSIKDQNISTPTPADTNTNNYEEAEAAFIRDKIIIVEEDEIEDKTEEAEEFHYDLEREEKEQEEFYRNLKQEEQKEKTSRNFELELGAKLPVWIGGIALILGTFFLVKYSIENSLISPELRLFFGGALGVALLAVSEFIRKNDKYQVPMRIRQATAGAGIAILYIIAYSAHNIYSFIGGTTAFLALTSVTITAIIFSVRSGMPIALMGLLGGFLTPMLVESTSPNPIMLFTYLYLLYGAIMMLIKMMGWSKLSLPATIGVLVWVLIFFTKSKFLIADVIILGLFLTAISLTHTALFRKDPAEKEESIFSSKLAILLPSIGSLSIFAFMIGKGGIELFEWGMYGLLSLATIGIAFFKPKEYAVAPAVGAVISAILVLAWKNAELSHLIIASSIFASIYAISCFYFSLRYKASAFIYSVIAAITPFIFYAINFYKYTTDKTLIKGVTGIVKVNQHIPTELLDGRASVLDFRNSIWALTAFILAAATVALISFVKKQWSDNKEMQHNIVAIFTVAATAFITMGLCISLERELLAVALALETAALAWLNTRLNTKWLRALTAAIAIGFVYVIFNQLAFLIVLGIKSIFGYSAGYSIPFSRIPILQSGIPALLFAIAGLYLYEKKDDNIVKFIETLFIGLITLTAYYIVRHVLHPDAGTTLHNPSFIERGITTNLFLIISIAAYNFGTKYKRDVFSSLGTALTCITLFRIGWFDIITDNPWDNISVAGNLFILNGTTLTFGLPIIGLIYQANILSKTKYSTLPKVIYSSCLAMIFALVTFWVRHLFSLSPDFSSRHMSDPEMYGYSITWLLLGVTLLVTGIKEKNTYIRYGSLAVLILTVGKVFFFDASKLDGLLRVFSFFGLGLVLMGMSYVYTKFVFKNEK